MVKGFMNDENTIATTTKESLSALLREFRAAGTSGDYWARQQSAEDTRLARWDGQSDDGKKWDKNLPEGQKAFPWNGASDVRCYQVDEVINESVATKLTAFWRSEVRVEGIEPGDIAAGSASTRFMEWMRDNDMRDNLNEDVELSAQWEDWYGWCGLHVCWDRQVSYKWRTIDLAELSQLGQQISQSPDMPQEVAMFGQRLSNLPAVVADPESESIAIEVVKLLYRIYVNQSLSRGLYEQDIPDLSATRAREVVRELRKADSAKIPIPYLCRNKPTVTALKPWRDIVVPADITDLESARAIFVRQFYSEADLRAMAISDEWDRDFVEEAVKTKGRLSVWTLSSQGLLNPLWQWTHSQQRQELIEIIVGYHKAVDEDGIIATYYTIFSAHLTTGENQSDQMLVAKSGMLEYPHAGEYPIVLVRRELLDRQVMSSRSMAEILGTSQREEKVLRDAVMDWCSIGVIPPMNVYKGAMGQRYKFAPGAENLCTAGREPKLLDIPGNGPTFAAQYLERIRANADTYFGRVRETVPPQLTQVLLEPRIRRFLAAWSKALKMAFCLYQHYAPEVFARVTSADNPVDDAVNLDFIFHFDVAQLNPEMMEQKLTAFSNLLPEDSVGVIDRSALIRAKARMIDPALARELVMDQGPASQQLFEKVKADVIGMSDGNEAAYTDAANDPTAQGRAQFLSQIIGANARYLSRLDPAVLQELGLRPMGEGGQVDPIFSSLMERYLKNIQLGVSQQQNKIVGRIGVNNSPAAAGAY